MKITIPVSVGELIDKITILEIKLLFSNSNDLEKELDELNLIKSTITQYIVDEELKLKKVNEKLWRLENKIREKEKRQEFDKEFIELARSVYKTNDLRAEIKKRINVITCSDLKELKIYAT